MKKGKHAWYIVTVPSAIGPLSYCCEAKSKKRINESDLSEALVRGNSKGLPVLFVTDGRLTKKVQEMLSSEFKSMKIKHL